MKEKNIKDGGMILLPILVIVLLFIWFHILKYPSSSFNTFNLFGGKLDKARE